MSSILLASPFPTAPLPSHPAPEGPSVVAVAPITSAAASSSTDDAASFTGSGAGGSKQAETVALFQNNDAGKWGLPANATGDSIVNAQAQTHDEAMPFGPPLPEVPMPDPLPTSPFLKGADDAT